MKIYTIALSHNSCDAINEIITNDLENLVLDQKIRSAYEEILLGMGSDYFGFRLDDDQVALEIAQMFLVYADRISDATGYNSRSHALISFVTQMMTSFTHKTAEDY